MDSSYKRIKFSELSEITESIQSFESDQDELNLKSVELRDYQRKLFEKAIDTNIIVCLPTGTGKTQIAINLIKNQLPTTIGPFPLVAKRTIFLAPTRVLVEQQHRCIREQVAAEVELVHGDLLPELFTLEEWNQYFKANQILVMTPQVLLDILVKCFIKISNLNLLIFDEAHWILKKEQALSMHPYRRIMDIFKEQTQHLSANHKPRIMCMSASILNSRTNNFDDTIDEIEQIFEATVETENTGFYLNEATVFVHECNNNTLFKTKVKRPNDLVFEAFEKISHLFDQIIEENTKKKLNLDISLVKSLNGALKKANEICYDLMGPWFTVEALDMYAQSWEKKATNELSVTLVSVFHYMQKSILDHFCTSSFYPNQAQLELGDFVSNKLTNLLKMLLVFKNQLNCIVFVTERIEANLVYRWLKYLSSNNDEYRFIKPGFICGTPSKDFVHFDQNTEEFKQKFESGDLNVMVATAVLEEGIDVPLCNVVIRYDFPMTSRAYIQSKGRARDAKSFFLLMVRETALCSVQRQRTLLLEFHQTELRLKNISDRDQTSSFPKLPPAIYQYYQTEKGAKLYENDSLKFLNHYTQKLPSDYFTDSRPNFIELSNSTETEFCCLFVLPINSSLCGIVRGEYKSSKPLAKLNCAFKVCQLLIQKGELDGHLNIVSNKFLLESHFQELNLKARLGDVFQKRPYLRVMSLYCDRLLSSTNTTASDVHFYLYKVTFPSYWLSEAMDEPFHSIGILTEFEFPFEQTESVFFLNNVQVTFSISLLQKNYLLDKYLAIKIRCFHNHIIQLVHSKPMTQRTSFDEPDKCANFLLLPLKGLTNQNEDNIIDFELIDSFYDWQNVMQQYHENVKKLELTQMAEPQLKVAFPKDALFGVFYQKQVSLLIVKDLNLYVKATDEFELKVEKQMISYVQYYKEKYNRIMEHLDLPMIHAGRAKSAINSKWKFSTDKIKQKNSQPKEDKKSLAKQIKVPHLYPVEFAVRYPLSFSDIVMWNSVPVILYRLEQFLIAHQFLEEFASDNSQPLKYEKINIEDLLSTQNKINSNKISSEGNEPSSSESQSDASDFKMVEIDEIDSNTLKASVNTIERQLVQGFPLLLPNFPQLRAAQEKKYDFLDELLNKLREVLCQVKNKKYTPRILKPNPVTKELLGYGDTSLFQHTGKIDGNIRFNTFHLVYYPNPWCLVKAFTLANANDAWSLEQLETVGDAFLKMTTVTYLYFRYMTLDEGKLTRLKMNLICNANLYKLALEKQLPKYLTWPLNREPKWTVPFYFTISEGSPKTDEDGQLLTFKAIADVVEALIGSFLVHGSAGAALSFFKWLGLPAFDPTEDISAKVDPIMNFKKRFENNFEESSFDSEQQRQEVDAFKVDIGQMVTDAYQNGLFAQVEELISYKFKHKYYLVQAFTHPSCSKTEYSKQVNYISSFQRLEFIGDAILDYVITHFVYLKNTRMSPYQMTQLRSAVVNNVFYASIVTRNNLHKYLRHYSPLLATSITNFAKKYKCQLLRQLDELINSTLAEPDSANIDEVDVPKALADIFEALVGAIYVDNGFDLDNLWTIVYKLIKVELDYFIQNIPSNPVFWLHKRFVNRFKFGKVTQITEVKQERELIVTDDDGTERTFMGCGQNKQQCSLSAAKRAMNYYNAKYAI